MCACVCVCVCVLYVNTLCMCCTQKFAIRGGDKVRSEDIMGQVLKRTLEADKLELLQIRVPIGVHPPCDI